jgi:molecular chaperone DnaK (HSP70)
MSVLGLDFGTANAVIAVAQRGGVDILANEASARLTAYVNWDRNFSNTIVSISELKAFLSCRYMPDLILLSNENLIIR